MWPTTIDSQQSSGHFVVDSSAYNICTKSYLIVILIYIYLFCLIVVEPIRNLSHIHRLLAFSQRIRPTQFLYTQKIGPERLCTRASKRQ